MKQFICILLAAILFRFVYIIFNNTRNRNNVCKTFEDYYTDRDNNKNCYYNPDYLLTVPEIIERYGYPVETHYVTTTDGYILTLFRIPHGRNFSVAKIGKPIFLQHGFLSNCGVFVNIGKNSLGFLLADEGYDVWLGNSRGTVYSTNHTRFSSTASEYWNFSFDELGGYDVPAQIDYVTNLTHTKITYIGFSLGGSLFYIYATTYPDSAFNQVEIFIGLAPAVFFTKRNIWLHYIDISHVEIINLFFSRLSVTFDFVKYVCFPYPFQMNLCKDFIGSTIGGGPNADPDNLPGILAHSYDTLNLKSLIHGAQWEKFQRSALFDYGLETNRKVYGISEPPLYDLNKMQTSIYLIGAENDKLVHKEGMERLHRATQNVTRSEIYMIKDKQFGHLDFLNGKDAARLVFNHIISVLKKNLA